MIKTKQKHNTICVRHYHAQEDTNDLHKTWTLLPTNGGKDTPNIVCKRDRNGTQNVKTHNTTTRITKKMSNTDATRNRGCTQVLRKGKQFLALLIHPPCYSYIQYLLNPTSRSKHEKHK